MRKATIILLIVAAVLSMSAIAYSGEILDEGDILFGPIDLQTVTGDSQLFGCVFIDDVFWITGGNSGGDPNKLYKLDENFNLLEVFDQPSHSIGTGWQNIAYDGINLYALIGDQIDEINVTTGQYTGFSISCPRSPNTGLEYNPITDRFWTSSPDGYIYSFDRNGAIVDSFPNTRMITGMGLNIDYPSGPIIWMHTRHGAGMLIEQFDFINGVFTGVTYDVMQWDGIAGGLCFGYYYYNYQTYAILFLIGQANNDFVLGMEIQRFGVPDWRMSCDIQIMTDHVPSVNGRILFEIFASNTGGNTIGTVVGEIYPTIGSCATGIPYDFNLNKFLGEDLRTGESITGYFFYDVPDVSGMGLSDAALTFDVGKGIDDYLCSDCDEFRFYNPWGRTRNEVIWGTQWLEWDRGDIPVQTSIGQNYPNPFNATTSIPFELSQARNVSLKVYNLSGQVVNELYNGYLDAGSHVVNWDASAVASGIYFYTLETGDITITKKMNLVK